MTSGLDRVARQEDAAWMREMLGGDSLSGHVLEAARKNLGEILARIEKGMASDAAFEFFRQYQPMPAYPGRRR